ncbi:MAG: FtsX-like permease family protein [Magnetococcales bacterium]|nr:FtsX-like permease family protein [Magnetococcales bacterium]
MSSLPWRVTLSLAWQGVWADRANILFFVSALFLVVATLTGVVATASFLQKTVDLEARALLGADLRLQASYPFEAFIESQVVAPGRRIDRGVEFSAMARTPDTQETLLVEVRGVSAHYPLRGTVALSLGGTLAAALADGGIVVEKNLLLRMGLQRGDKLLLGKGIFTIRDTLEKESDQVTRFFSLGPRVMIGLPEVAGTQLIQKGSRVKQIAWVNLAEGEALAGVAEQLKERAQTAGIRLLTPSESQSSVRRFMRRFGVFLGLTGLLTLLLSGLGMGGAMGVHIQENRDKIATLKCLGADSGSIMALYGWQTVIITLPAAFLGALVGLILPWGLLSLLAGLFPPSLTYTPSPLLGLVGVGAGLFFALIFSLGPLLQTRKISPALLFSRREGGGTFSDKALWLTVAAVTLIPALWVARLMGEGRLGWMFVGALLLSLLIVWTFSLLSMALLKRLQPAQVAGQLALAGLCRSGGGTVLVSLGLGLGLVFTLFFLSRNLDNQILNRLPDKVPSFFFIDIQPHQVEPFKKVVSPFATEDQSVRLTPVIRGRLTALNGQKMTQHLMNKVEEEGASNHGHSHRWMFTREYVLTASATLPPGNQLVEGRWWQENELEAGLQGISMESELARGLGVKVGDTVTFDIQGIPITAPLINLRAVRWRDMGLNFFVVFSPAVLSGAPLTYLATVATPPEAEEALFSAVTEQFTNISAIASRKVMLSISQLLLQLAQVVRILGGVAVVSGLLVLAVHVAASRRRRAKESAVCRLQGATRGEMLQVVLIEFALMGLIASVAGLLVSHLLSAVVVVGVMDDQWQGLPLWSFLAVTAGVGLVVMTGLAGAYRELGRPVMAVLLERES